jgi:hypothetical protein
MTVRSTLVQLVAKAILVGLKLRAALARRFVAEQAVSTLTGLRCQTKPHSTEDTRRYGRAEKVPLKGRDSRARTPPTTTGKQAPEMHQASSTKRGARSKEQR